MKQKTRGFTLIELMIVVTVMAIIVTIAYPLYIEHAYKARRSDAKAGLTDAAQVLERCRTNTNTYVSCFSTTDSSEGYYTITPTLAANTYTLVATVKTTAAQAGDSKCASFSLTHTGSKTATSSDCW